MFRTDETFPIMIDTSYSVEESWVQCAPKIGDHIRVKRLDGLYAHHGIYVSDDEAIHFTGKEDDSILDWSKPEVISSDLQEFLKGGVLEIKEYSDEEFKDLYSPEQIVTYARACLGDKGYNLIFNNCEHFANVCTLGRFRSNQVERVLQGKLPNEEEEKNMGLFGRIGDAIKTFFGGGSSGSGGGSRSTTTYEPDKVKIAEIESDTKIRLAHMETERIEIMKQARIDILQFETESQVALEKAKVQGLNLMAQTIVALQEKLNEIAEKRILIIEKGSLEVVKDIERFYDELGAKIQEDNNRYSTEKLPELLSILEKYEEGSVAQQLYKKRIEDDMNLKTQHYLNQISSISQRQTQVIDGFLQSKDKILEQTGQMTMQMFENIKVQSSFLDMKRESGQGVNQVSLEDNKKLALSEE